MVDHFHYMNMLDGTQWGGWKAVPGGGTTNLADAAAAYNGKLYLFGIGIGDHAHYMKFFKPETGLATCVAELIVRREHHQDFHVCLLMCFFQITD